METVEKFVLTQDDFLFFERQVLSMGYRENTTTNIRRLFERLEITPPRKVIGREVTYSYKSREIGNNYTVILHTTYIRASKKWRETDTDSGWCLIIEGDKAKYFAKPFLRTKGFILKFLRYAWVTKWKVDHRPLCPECQAYMQIAKKKDKRQYYWACHKNTIHAENKPVFSSWDFGFPLNATKFVNIRREYTIRYHRKNKKEGKIVTPAPKIRKKSIIGKPENLV